MRIALCGLGRAGTQMIQLLLRQNTHTLACVFCRNGSPKVGKTVSEVLRIPDVACRIHELREAEAVLMQDRPDVLIDFSSKKATLFLLPLCAKLGVRMVVGTTGFTEPELARLKNTSLNTPGFSLVYAPNITLGVNVMMMLAEQTAACLPDYDYAVTEKHYRRKADVSATAEKLTTMLSDKLNKPVALNSIRAGGYVGLHELLVVGEFERITIIHESFTRQAFANGALIAAEYLAAHDGFFEMQEIMRDHVNNTGKAE